MIIKKHPNGNKYCLIEGKWIRNFTNPLGAFVDINNTIDPKDHFIFLKNETQNGFLKSSWIDSENFYHEKIVIVSDGYDFENKHKILNDLPKDVTIIAVNGALAKWKNTRLPNYYIVNNPYKECLKYLPKNITPPKCIASARTNSDFLRNYRGIKYRYYPVNEKDYSSLGIKEVKWQIDDYRNPICAAVVLSYHFGVEKLMLFCCDDSFKDKRDGAIQLENKLWTYPQQKTAQELVEGNLYWLGNQDYKEVSVYNHSSGLIYKNASYIEEDGVSSIFKE